VTTRAQVESEIVARLGGWLTAAGLDGRTTDGTNADLASPIAWAIGQSGGSIADPSDPNDADLATATGAAAQVSDLAEYRALLNVYQNYTKVDVSAPAGSVKKDQLRQAMWAAILRKQASLRLVYGIEVGAAFAAATSSSVGNRFVW